MDVRQPHPGDPPSRRRPRHEPAIKALREAMASLKDDYASGEARGHMLAALRVLERGVAREVKKRTAAQEAYDRAVGLHNDWWAKIQERVRESAKEPPKELPKELPGGTKQ